MIDLLLSVHYAIFVSLLGITGLARLSSRKVGFEFTYTLYLCVPIIIILASIAPLLSTSIDSTAIAVAYAATSEIVSPVTQTLESNVWIQVIWCAGSLYFSALLLKTALQSSFLQLSRIASDRFGRNDVFTLVNKNEGPMSVGFFKPFIVLPSDYKTRFDDEQLNLIIQHEAVHVRRYDNLANLFAGIVLCVFWFNPFLWLAYREFRTYQEASIDEAVVKKSSSKAIHYSLAMIRAVDRSSVSSSLSIHPYYGDVKMLKKRMSFLKTPAEGSLSVKLASLVWLSIVIATASLGGFAATQKAVAAAEPKVLVSIAPPYPRNAMQEAISSEVIVQYDLASGSSEPSNVTIVSSTDTDYQSKFEESAIWAMTRFRFAPENNNREGLLQKFSYQLPE